MHTTHTCTHLALTTLCAFITPQSDVLDNVTDKDKGRKEGGRKDRLFPFLAHMLLCPS